MKLEIIDILIIHIIFVLMNKHTLLFFTFWFVLISNVIANPVSTNSDNNEEQTINAIFFGILIFIPIVATLTCMFIVTSWVLYDHYKRYYNNNNSFMI